MPRSTKGRRPVTVLLTTLLSLALVTGALGSFSRNVTSGSDSPAVQAVQSVLDGGVSEAQAAPRPSNKDEAKFHKGYKVADRWVGSWRTSQGASFCVEFNQLRAKYKVGAKRVTGNLDRLTADQTRRALWIAEKYRSSSNKNAAAAAIAVWRLENSGSFKSWYKRNKSSLKKKGLVSLSDKIMAASKNAGKNALSVSSTQAFPGQVATGKIVGRIDNKPASGAVSTVTLTNATVRTIKVKLDSAGVGVFRYIVKSTGRVSGAASLRVPGKSGYVSKDTSRQQVIFYRTTKTIVTKPFSYEKKPAGPKVVNVCDTDCRKAGKAPVTVSQKVECSAPAVRTVFTALGKTYTFDTAPCKTNSKTVELPDNTKVQAISYVLVNGKYVAVSAPVNFVVECPPWITASGHAANVTDVTWECEKCSESTKTSSATVTLVAPKTSRSYSVLLQVEGKTVKGPIALAGGQTKTVDIGGVNPATVSIKFTIYRLPGLKGGAISTHVLKSKSEPPVKD